jgi:hypothetical protein
MSQATESLQVAISPDVAAFAAEKGVALILHRVLEMTHVIFPRAALDVRIEDDPEIADDRHIVVALNYREMTVAEALEARYRWHRELFACCPAPQVCVFRLGLELGR